MMQISVSELLLCGGIATMVGAALMGALCVAVFRYTGRRLKKRLIKEYGTLES